MELCSLAELQTRHNMQHVGRLNVLSVTLSLKFSKAVQLQNPHFGAVRSTAVHFTNSTRSKPDWGNTIGYGRSPCTTVVQGVVAIACGAVWGDMLSGACPLGDNNTQNLCTVNRF